MSGRTTVHGRAGPDHEGASRARHPTHARRPRRPPPPAHFWVIVLAAAVLVLLGLVMVLSSTSVLALNAGHSTWHYLQRQVVGAALGTAAMAVALRVDLHWWRRHARLALAVSLGLLVLTLVAGQQRQGARAWLALGPLGLQPAELVKLTLLVACADLLARRADRMHELRVTFVPVLVWLGVAGALIMAQNDLGSAIVVAAIVLAVAFLAGTPLAPFVGITGLMAAVAYAFTMSTPYRRRRIDAFLHPSSFASSWGFQVRQSQVGIASGGLLGVGIGASKAKWGFLPEAHTDFIFAIIAEELGFVGAAVVCCLFVILALFGARVAMRAEDRFAALVAGGVTTWISVQALINVGGATHLVPLTGLTLPFVSFGSSSLMVTMAAAGLLANVARSTR